MFQSYDRSDTIFATATGIAQGAITLIRLSGDRVFEGIEAIFRSKSKTVVKLSEATPYSIIFGEIVEGDAIIDEVLISIFKAPKSYTGEHSVEISCHASPYIEQKIQELLLAQGLRMALPGEFSMRAFLNGKLDLLQADAVADLIASRSAAAHQAAISQMRGGYSKTIAKLRQQMVDFASLLELELDFSEEDVEFADRSRFSELLANIRLEAERLLQAFKWGQVMKEGVSVAIVGKPNVGKSTLLNALLKEDKAIVSAIPGTTRDSIEDSIQLQGIMFRFIDTAGLRQSKDEIEQIGVQRAKEKLKKAHIVLFVCNLEDKESVDKVMVDIEHLSIDRAAQQLVLVVNKIDETDTELWQNLPKLPMPVVPMAAKTNLGLEHLEKQLIEAVQRWQFEDRAVEQNVRHINSLEKVLQSLQQIAEDFENELATDLVAIDVRQCLYYLGEVTGSVSSDELLGNIFGRFCIGK